LFGPSEVAVIHDPNNAARIACARGDLDTARSLADGAASMTRGVHRVIALTTRCRVTIAQRDLEHAERDAHDALSIAVSVHAYLLVPEALECLASLAAGAGRSHEAVRLFGAADAARVRIGVYRQTFDSSLALLRKELADTKFDADWAEGAALSTDEAIAYAQRGRGERKRPASGWGSLTLSELDVAGLVCEELTNKDIAARLFVSPRTVQTHLAHVYTKLGLTSRVQLAQKAARQSACTE
jgi:DNA-binding CsgD family transcriptional regulator